MCQPLATHVHNAHAGTRLMGLYFMWKFKLALISSLFVSGMAYGQSKVYSHPVEKYTVEYPQDWLLRQKEGVMNIYAPVDGPSDKEYENFGVSVYPASGMTAEQYYRTYVKDLPSAFSQFEMVSEDDWELTGKKAKWLECRFHDGTRSITNLICLLVHRDRLFIMVGYSTSRMYPTYKDSFVAMMRSLTLE